jgi:hypothetical protein
VDINGKIAYATHSGFVYINNDLEVVPNERLIWTDALLPGYRPSPEPFMTAVLTLEQSGGVVQAVGRETPAMLSVFAGRVADTGRDPVPHMAQAVRMAATEKVAKLLLSYRGGYILRQLSRHLQGSARRPTYPQRSLI